MSFKPKGKYELHSLLPNILQLQMDNFKISEIEEYLIFVQ